MNTIEPLWTTLQTQASNCRFVILRKSLTGSRCLPLSTSTLKFADISEDLPKRRPPRYFDLKKFRAYLKRHKEHEEEKEARQIALTYARPPPDGWDVSRFLKACKVGENLEEVLAEFPSWQQLVTADSEKLASVRALTTEQRRHLRRKINLFNHGLWPAAYQRKAFEEFQAAPLANEGKPWTDEDDQRLLELADYYDVDFGDPWIYISWEMQREFVDVYNRYVDLAVKPKTRTSEWEIVISKACRPLLMNRAFKLLPAFVYIIPSEENFPLAKVSGGTARGGSCSAEDSAPAWLPLQFRRYRNPRLFRSQESYLSQDSTAPSSAQASTTFTCGTELIQTDLIGNSRDSASGISLLSSS